jgi:hypothetical protein
MKKNYEILYNLIASSVFTIYTILHCMFYGFSINSVIIISAVIISYSYIISFSWLLKKNNDIDNRLLKCIIYLIHNFSLYLIFIVLLSKIISLNVIFKVVLIITYLIYQIHIYFKFYNHI